MTNAELRNAIEAIVYDALLAEITAAYSDDPSRAPSCADVTTKIMAAIDTMDAIAEGSDIDEMTINYDDESSFDVYGVQNLLRDAQGLPETEHWFTVAWYGTTHMITIHDDHGTHTEIHARKMDSDQRLASLCAAGYKLRPTSTEPARWYAVLSESSGTMLTIHDETDGTCSEWYGPTWTVAANQRVTELRADGYELYQRSIQEQLADLAAWEADTGLHTLTENPSATEPTDR